MHANCNQGPENVPGGTAKKSLNLQSSTLYMWGRLEEVMKLYKEEEHLRHQLEDQAGLSKCICSQGNILWGKHDEAMALYKEEEGICRKSGDQNGLMGSLGNQANILHE